MMAALRLLQDRGAGTVPPVDVVTDAAETLEKLAAVLEPYLVDEGSQLTGRLHEPGRGQSLVPVLEVDEWTADVVRGRFELGRFYLGRRAAHGGAVALLFDDILGRLANTDRSLCRTAYLHVNYRALTPIGEPLRLEARVDRIEGRKRFITGVVTHGNTVTADAESLFVEMRTDLTP